MSHVLAVTIYFLLLHKSFIYGHTFPLVNTLSHAEKTLLPPGMEEKCVTVTFPADQVKPLKLKSQQFLFLSHDVKKPTIIQAFHVLKTQSWFVIGLAGSNMTSLERISNVLNMLPQHLIVVERKQRPFEWEMDLQNRHLVWKVPNGLSQVLQNMALLKTNEQRSKNITSRVDTAIFFIALPWVCQRAME